MSFHPQSGKQMVDIPQGIKTFAALSQEKQTITRNSLNSNSVHAMKTRIVVEIIFHRTRQSIQWRLNTRSRPLRNAS